MLEKYLVTAFGDIATEDSTKKIKLNSEKGIYDSSIDYDDDDDGEDEDVIPYRREPTPEDEEFWL